MRVWILYVLCSLLSTAVFAQLQQVVVTYPDANTPQSVLDSAKEKIQEAGEVITHEYQLIKSFAATISAETLAEVKALSADYIPIIEIDETVWAQSDDEEEQAL